MGPHGCDPQLMPIKRDQSFYYQLTRGSPMVI